MNCRNFITGAGALVVSSRVISADRALLPYGLTASSLEGESQYSSAMNHQHELFEEWEDIPLTATVTAGTPPPQCCKAGDVVLLRGICSYSGLVDGVFATLEPKFRPENHLRWVAIENGSLSYDLIVESTGKIWLSEVTVFTPRMDGINANLVSKLLRS